MGDAPDPPPLCLLFLSDGFDPAGTGGTPYDTLTPDDYCRWARDVRRGLEKQGASFDREASPLSDSDSETSTSSSGADGAEWAALAELEWKLRSDRVVDRGTAADFFGSRPALAAWVEAEAEALAAVDPHLRAKSRSARLQFVAMGADWNRALRTSPTLADYLEDEAQAFDLGLILADLPR